MSRSAFPLAVLGLMVACATAGGRPVAADEEVEKEEAPKLQGARNVRAAPSDASPCLLSSEGRDVKDLLAGDVGKIVVIEGEMRLALVICSQLLCEVKCCNRCGGQIVIGGDEAGIGGVQVGTMGGERVACSGTDCGMTCPGFAPGHRYRVQGKLRGPPPGVTGPFPYAIDAEAVCRRITE